MSLLDQEIKKEEPKGKKIVLLLLILCVFALMMVTVMMMALSKKQVKGISISINGADIELEEGLLIKDKNGVDYISIQKIAKLTGYNYLTGEYKDYSEDTTNTKCYLENENQVIQFEAGSKKIYKIDPSTNLDYEEYELKNVILKQNNIVYIALDDMKVGLNVLYSYSEVDNKILLQTVEDLYTQYQTNLPLETKEDAFIEISSENNNKKAIAYNMLIVANESKKWGVINSTDFSTIIGNKYSSIEFIESAGVFIASDNDKYGVISEEKPIIDLKWEAVNIINNNPLCYEVKSGESCAIVNEEGKAITNNLYSRVGCTSQNALEDPVLVIDKLDDAEVSILVVCKDEKYGLLNLKDGSSIGDCILDKVYSKNEEGKKVYYVQLYEQEFLLKNYIETINTTIIDVGQ